MLKSCEQMARCSSSVRYVLRNVSRISRPNFCSRSLCSSSRPSEDSSQNLPLSSPSLRLNYPYFTAFSRGQFQHGRDLEGEDVPAIRGEFTPSVADPKRSSSVTSSRNTAWPSGSQEFSPLLITSRLQSRYAGSTSMFLTMMHCKGFSSAAAKDDNQGDATPANLYDGSPEHVENTTDSLRNLAEKGYNSILDVATAAQQAFDEVSPQIRALLEAYPVIKDVTVSVGVFTGAWVILPRVLRRLHGYVEQGSAALLQGQERLQTVPYELSAWKAMEDPARLFATLLTLLQVGMLVKPSAAVAESLTQLWSGGSVLCVVWFLHRWKSNVIKRLLTGRKVSKEDREHYLGLDKFMSLGLIFVAALGVAEAAGVAVSSLLTVGGIGGIVTAFAAREILSNLLTGLTLSFSKTFSVGDTIKAGTVEGKVEEVGLTSTRLLNLDKYPIMVPNAFFTSQAIVNKSRCPWRALSVKIPIKLEDFEKVPTITLEIREMLYQNPQVYLDEDKPSCHIAQFAPTALEIAITCNIKPMSKNEYFLVEQDILLESARIIITAGAKLGGQ